MISGPRDRVAALENTASCKGLRSRAIDHRYQPWSMPRPLRRMPKGLGQGAASTRRSAEEATPMLRKEQNDLLTQTGPGTPAGRLFCCYWLPALLAEELPENDCPPVRVKILSERLLAFRDSEGRLGLIDEFCAHRGVSLWFGRNEEGGLRCPYHGWKYDVGGQCVEVPSEPAESGFCQKIKLKSYPIAERGGVIWVYMG